MAGILPADVEQDFWAFTLTMGTKMAVIFYQEIGSKIAGIYQKIWNLMSGLLHVKQRG
jgi:hypothetical protein